MTILSTLGILIPSMAPTERTDTMTAATAPTTAFPIYITTPSGGQDRYCGDVDATNANMALLMYAEQNGIEDGAIAEQGCRVILSNGGQFIHYTYPPKNDTPAPVQYVTKATGELEQGDVVTCHGMRCLIDGPMVESLSHPQDDPRGPVLYTKALVLNRDDEATRAVPHAWTLDWQRNGKPTNGQHRWTIQGNNLARWSVEA